MLPADYDRRGVFIGMNQIHFAIMLLFKLKKKISILVIIVLNQRRQKIAVNQPHTIDDDRLVIHIIHLQKRPECSSPSPDTVTKPGNSGWQRLLPNLRRRAATVRKQWFSESFS
jgi:hypothetical protein